MAPLMTPFKYNTHIPCMSLALIAFEAIVAKPLCVKLIHKLMR